VRLPSTLNAPAFADHVRAAVPFFAHHFLEVRESRGEPLAVMLEELAIAREAGAIPEVDDFVGSPEATGVVCWITDLDAVAPGERRAWGDFVREVSIATRRWPTGTLTPQVAVLAAGALAELEPTEPGWSSLYWWGRLGRLDIALHVQRVAPSIDPAFRSSVVELAGFDLGLAERLTVEGSTELPELTAVVRDAWNGTHLVDNLHRRRGTCGADAPGGLLDAWEKGAVDRFDGQDQPFWHSALYAEEDGLVTLRRRLWRGQVHELLPRLEEWRVQLVDVAKDEGIIARSLRLEELDFAQLHDHLRKGRHDRRRSELAEFAGWMRANRNKIAHLQAVDQAARAQGERLARRCLP
jgi:hypothetical protein